MGLFDKIFGSYSDRELKKIDPIINKIESLDKPTQALSDQELKDKTAEFQKRLKNGESLDDILPEAFAVCREASYRVLGMRHYRVQLYGGVILHQGRIAEMKTGEGKTLMATLAAYLNALTGKGVHVVTVNDYLATRDRQWMGKVYEFLGLSVGNIVHGLSPVERREAYNADITYGTNNEFGFDYLRDNMVIYKEERVQRELNFAIVDEVDSILIDEARTPLIISGQGAESTDLYMRADNFVKKLTHRVIEESEKTSDPFDREFKEETVDYLVDEKQKSASLTDLGVEKAEQFFNIDNLADPNNMEIAHNIKQALKANSVMKRDVDYVVKDGEIIIVDEFTGRMMLGRRYSDGLHQAIEAKEGMEIKKESKTLATITFQNYFRMYKKLSGMTGTAKTEEEEFREIYNVDVIEVPTNKPVIRKDEDDGIYSTEAGKYMAVINDIKECHAKGQPVLVGTVSIDKSELLSSLLKKQGIKHNVLNAKFHEQESEIVAQAGRLGAVTIATNMAGRGTDIVLGGNPEYMAKEVMKKKNLEDEVFEQIDGYAETDNAEILAAREEYKNLVEKFKEETKEEAAQVVKAGGLRIIGTERHESRRIDNQLRGRSGRQGDPGSSKFYISAEDDLIRLFAGERFKQVMEKSKVEEDESLETPILTKLIETAQRRVESNNFAIRKSVLKYDDVMNKQRGIIYGERKKVLEGQDLKDDIIKMVDGIISDEIHFFLRSKVDEGSRDYEGLFRNLNEIFDFNENDFGKLKDLKNIDDLEAKAKEIARDKYSNKEDEFGDGVFREVERVVLLQVVDEKWMDHIDAMDQLKRGIGLRAMGNEDPVRAYGNEGFDMFEAMNDAIRRDTVKMLYHVINPERMERKRVAKNISEVGGSNTGEEKKGKTFVRKEKKIGRNDPCPCGSGKKYKNCHGR